MHTCIFLILVPLALAQDGTFDEEIGSPTEGVPEFCADCVTVDQTCVDGLRLACQTGVDHCDICHCAGCDSTSAECHAAAEQYVALMCSDGSEDSLCECDPLSECTETDDGGYSCGPCPNGYEGGSDIGLGESGCVDLNECDTDNGGCDALAECINSPGAYRCGPCPEGYEGDGSVGCTLRAQIVMDRGDLKTYLGAFSDAKYIFDDQLEVSVRRLHELANLLTENFDTFRDDYSENLGSHEQQFNAIMNLIENLSGESNVLMDQVSIIEEQLGLHGLLDSSVDEGVSSALQALQQRYNADVTTLQGIVSQINTQMEQARECAAEGKVWNGDDGCEDSQVLVATHEAVCNEASAGLLRWHDQTQSVQLCNGEEYVGVSAQREFGSSRDFPGESCWQIMRDTPFSSETAVRWVTYGLSEPFEVTCDNRGYVHVHPHPSSYGRNGWLGSHSSTNSMWKCRCNRFHNQFQGIGSNWRWGRTGNGYGNQRCQNYHTFQYWSKDDNQQLSYAQINALAAHAREGATNVGVYTVSCDDDHQGYPRGHWIAFETAPNSNNFREQDCRSGEGGGGQRCPTCPTSNNGGCCERRAGNVWQSFPLPRRVCVSINTGGGAAVLFTTTDIVMRAPNRDP